MNIQDEQIGFIIDCNRVLCGRCMTIFQGSPASGDYTCSRLYRVNIGDYKQTCHECGIVLVEGKTPAWCELFPKERFKSLPDVKKLFRDADNYAACAIQSIETIRTELKAGSAGCTTLDAIEYLTRLSIILGKLRILEEHSR